MALLRARGQQVFLVSGGFRQVIHPLAASLDIPLSHVFANTILHDVSGRPAGTHACVCVCACMPACMVLEHTAPAAA